MPVVCRIVLGVDLIFWYVRILHYFAAYERLGPKLIMIFNTVKCRRTVRHSGTVV
jgi:hypothetical protein